MTTWKQLVQSGLIRYNEQTDRREIELEEVYNYTLEQARDVFPQNNHPKAKIRQTLQLLRDRDEVEFLGEGEYRLTEELIRGEQFEASEKDQFTAHVYKQAAHARALDPAFRETALQNFDQTCPISGVDHPNLLDVAHILPWSEYQEHRANLENVLVLDKTHHAAFDSGLFTIDADLRLWANPEFETESNILTQTIVGQDGEPIEFPPNTSVKPEYLATRNGKLEWWAEN